VPGPAWYENVGSQSRPILELRGTVVEAPLAGHNPAPCVVDWNEDGKLDVIVGAEGYQRSFASNRRGAPAREKLDSNVTMLPIGDV